MGIKTVDRVRVLNPLETQAVELALKQGPLDQGEIQIATGTDGGVPYVALGRVHGSTVEIPLPDEPVDEPATA